MSFLEYGKCQQFELRLYIRPLIRMIYENTHILLNESILNERPMTPANRSAAWRALLQKRQERFEGNWFSGTFCIKGGASCCTYSYLPLLIQPALSSHVEEGTEEH